MDIIALALPLVKARLNRLAGDTTQDGYLESRLRGVQQEMERTGIVLNAVLPGKDEYSFGGDAPERADEPEMRFPLEGELPKEVKEA